MSKYIRGLGFTGALVSTVYSGNKVINQIQARGISNVNPLDALDTGMGIAGTITTGLLITGSIVASPFTAAIGIGVTVYFGLRLAYDFYKGATD